MNKLTKEQQEKLIKSIEEVIDYLWIDEKKNYSESKKPKVHIYRTLKEIKKLIKKTKVREKSNVEILKNLISRDYLMDNDMPY